MFSEPVQFIFWWMIEGDFLFCRIFSQTQNAKRAIMPLTQSTLIFWQKYCLYCDKPFDILRNHFCTWNIDPLTFRSLTTSKRLVAQNGKNTAQKWLAFQQKLMFSRTLSKFTCECYISLKSINLQICKFEIESKDHFLGGFQYSSGNPGVRPAFSSWCCSKMTLSVFWIVWSETILEIE